MSEWRRENGRGEISMRCKVKGILCLGLLVWTLYVSFQAQINRGSLAGAGEKLWLKEEEGVLAGDVRRRKRELPKEAAALEFIAWKEQEKAWLWNPQTGKSSQAELLYLCGSSRLLYPGAPVLDGEDRKGCLLGKKAAWELFGSEIAGGLTLYLNETAYQVRGVLSEDSRRIVVEAGDEVMLDQITARIPAGQTRQMAEQTLQASYGISGTPLEFDLLCVLAGAGTAILWACLGIAALLFLRRYETRIGIRRGWKRWVLTSGLVLLWGGFAVSQMAVPVEYLPSKWSDFDFFATLWQEKKEALCYLLRAEKPGPQAGWCALFIRTILFQAVGSLGWLMLGVLPGKGGTMHSSKNVL